ncbi:MAG: Ig domain-containing protein, partial [Planctomycetota bacterium]|nr:Ig domain-containing protein [Planctomycetota bacterium]
MMSDSEIVTIGSTGHPLASTPSTPYRFTATDSIGNQTSDQVPAAVAIPGPSTTLATPTLYSAGSSPGAVTLYWSPVAGATDYTIKYGTTTDALNNSVDAQNTTSYTVSLNSTVTNYFTVTASDSQGDFSAPSSRKHSLAQFVSGAVIDGGFESADSSAWTLNRGSVNTGDNANSGGWYTPPDGSAHLLELDSNYEVDASTGWMDSWSGASATQSIYLRNSSYYLSFYAASPDGQTLSAGLIDGNNQYLTPANTWTSAAGSFTLYTLQYDITTAANYNISFSLPNPNDGTFNTYAAFVDGVTMTVMNGLSQPVIASATGADSQVHLTWNSVSYSTGYIVHFGPSTDNYTQSIDVGNTFSLDANFPATTSAYYFAISAYDGSGRESNLSNEKFAPSETLVTPAPTINGINQTSTGAVLNISNSNNASSFQVFWGVGASGYSNSAIFPDVSPQAVNAATGAPFTGALGHVSSNFIGSLANYSPTIQWGDGNSTTGSFVPDGTGGAWVTGNYTYAAPPSSAPTITLTDPNGNQAQYSTNMSVNSRLPVGWTATSVGAPQLGSGEAQPSNGIWTSISNGTWTIMGGGTGFGALTDQFNYAEQSYYGDGTLVAQINPNTTNLAAASGIMFRNSLDPASPFAAISLVGGNLEFQSRIAGGVTQTVTQVTGVTSAVWVEMIRTGNSVSAYYQVNSRTATSSTATWAQIGSSLASTSYMLGGAFASSGSNSSQSLLKVQDVTLGSVVLANHQWDDALSPLNGGADESNVGWSFSGNSGLANLSPWSSELTGPVGYVGAQGSISQTAYFPAGAYALRFRSEAFQGASFQVLVDGKSIDSFAPLYDLNNPWYLVSHFWTTDTFPVTGGQHTVTFTGLGNGTNTRLVSYIGDVHIVAAADAVPVPNYGFENGASSWNFGSNTGVQTNGAAQGSNVAYLTGTGAITQTFGNWPSGTYAISFEAAQASSGSNETFKVLIDGNDVGVGNFQPTQTGFTQFTTAPFPVTAGPHTMTLTGTYTGSGSYTAYVDDIHINAAPSTSVNVAAAPTNLIVTGTTTSKIVLQWQDSQQDASQFVIDRSSDPNFTQNLTTFYTGGTSRNFTDTTVGSGQTYYYRVRASFSPESVDGGVPANDGFQFAPVSDSGETNSVSAQALAPTVNLTVDNLQITILPPAQQNGNVLNYFGPVAHFTAGPDATASTYTAVVNWGTYGSPEKRSNNPFDPASPVNIISDGTGGWIIQAKANGELAGPGTYTYTVALIDGNSRTVASASGTATFITVDTSAPKLTATATVGGPINLRWTDANTNTYNGAYELDRSTNGIDFAPVTVSIQSEPSNARPYTWNGFQTGYATLAVDNSVQPGTTYYYRVKDTSGTFTGAYSPVVSATVSLPSPNSYAAQPIQSLLMPLDNSTIQTITLATGVHYKLQASGAFQIASNPYYADAQYMFDGTNIYQQVNSTQSGINYGIAINDSVLDQNKPAYWGAYSSNHIYSIDIVGTGKPISISYHDDDAFDNKTTGAYPGITLSIYQQNNVSVPVNVDLPPVFVSTPVTDVTLSSAYSYQAKAIDPDNLGVISYSILSPSINNAAHPNNQITVNSTTGLVNWQPTPDEVGGTYYVTLTATDIAGYTAVRSYDIAVHADPNQPDVQIVTQVPPTTITYSPASNITLLPYGDNSWKYLNTVQNNGQPIEDQFQNGGQITNGFATGTAPFGVPESGSVYFLDLNNATPSTIATLNVWPINSDLELVHAFNLPAGVQLQSLNLSLRIDNDAEVWVNGIPVPPVTGTPEPFTVQSGVASNSPEMITIPVTDLRAGNNFLAIRAHDRGVLDYFDAQLGGNLPFTYQVKASDSNNYPLTYSLTRKPDGMTIDPSTGLIVWPVPNGSPNVNVTVQVTDGHGGLATQSFTLDVSLTSSPQTINGTVSYAGAGNYTGSQPQVYLDLNNSGVYQTGDPIVTANADGTYSLSVNGGARYSVGALPPAGYVVTSPAILEQMVDVPIGSDVSGVNFSFQHATVPVTGLAIGPSSLTATVGQTLDFNPTVTNLSGTLLTFSLPAHPDGMVVDSRTGMVQWTPIASQVGPQNMIMKVTDLAGETFVRPFTVTVSAAFIEPTIASYPSAAFVGTPWTYPVIMSAPGTFSYQVIRPSSMNLSGSTVTWTPATTGTYSFDLRVTDTATGFVQDQQLNLTVSAQPPAHAPVIDSVPSPVAVLGKRYISAIIAHDTDGSPITYSLVENGTDSSVAQSEGSQLLIDPQTGIIHTSNGFSVTANINLTAKASNAYGLTTAPFTISIDSWAGVSPPQFTSTPLINATVGHGYLYQATASDSAGGPLIWSLLKAPVGMQVNQGTGAVTWTPSGDEFGTQNALLQVIGGGGLSATQPIALLVHGASLPPQIVSEPPGQASVFTSYTYQVMAVDPQNYPLIYSLSANPSGLPTGMSINSTTGLITWNSPAATNKVFTVTVGNGQVDSAQNPTQASQSFTISVVNAVVDPIPQFTTLPNTYWTIGQTYSYQANAVPGLTGGSIQYALPISPAGMTIIPSTGAITFNPPALDAANPNATYEYPVAITATDQLGAIATQVYTLTIVPNHPPKFVTTGPLAATQGIAYSTMILAKDADHDTLTYTLQSVTNGGGLQNASLLGISFDTGSGQLSWANPLTGIYSLLVSVTDGRSAPVSETLQLTVNGTQLSPTLNIFDLNPIVGASAPIYVKAMPAVGTTIQSLNLAITDTTTFVTVDIPLDAKGFGAYTFPNTDHYNLVATATDSDGGQVTNTLGVTPASTTTASVKLAAPTNTITSSSPISGTLTYTVSSNYALTATPIDASTGNPTGSTINLKTDSLTGSGSATLQYLLDPTTLASGEYLLTLSETPTGGGAAQSATAIVDVESQVKLGNFSLNFNDVTLSAGGFPITVTRTYNSLNAGTSGDFGNGWTLGGRNTNLKVTGLASLANSGFSNTGGQSFASFQPGTNVWITIPGQKPEEFKFYPTADTAWFSTDFLPAFVAAKSSNHDTLSVAGNDQVYIQQIDSGAFVDPGSLNSYNPMDPQFGEQFVLTTPAGLSYTIDPSSGNIVSEADANGNTITFGDSGISSNGNSVVTFNRTGSNITSIVYPNSGGTGLTTVSYTYSGSNDLIGFTNAATGAMYAYAYSDLTRPHFLTGITQGAKVLLQVGYLPGGAMTLTNGDGNTSSLGVASTISYNDDGSTQSQQTATDPLRYGTITIVDQNDNVVRTIKQIDHPELPISSSSVHCQVVISEYDTNNYLIAQSKPFPSSGDNAQLAQPPGYSNVG